MTVNLYEAHQQWASRPADERFSSLEDLAAHVRARHDGARDEVVSIRDLHVAIVGERGIRLNHYQQTADRSVYPLGVRATLHDRSYPQSTSGRISDIFRTSSWSGLPDFARKK